MAFGITDSIRLHVKQGDKEGDIVINFYRGHGTVHIKYNGNLPEQIIRDFEEMTDKQPWFDCSVCYTSRLADL